jgi:hypothetical protein
VSVFLHPTEGIQLEHFEEPGELRLVVRQALLDGADWRDTFSGETGIGGVLWEKWSPALQAAGMDRGAFLDVVVGYGRELWLWAMGERQWNEFVTGLSGRVSRRLPER